MISQPILDATRDALVSFALEGIDDGGHEGIAYWAGRELGDVTVFLQSIVPNAEHATGRVMVQREEIGMTARVARASKLGVLAQIHSHPGHDARHSDGDDDLVLLPFENMLSIVVPRFGIGWYTIDGACVHQFQDGRWVLCSAESVRTNCVVVAPSLDLRKIGA